MSAIVFDIETGPIPEKELLAMLPPFDPDNVKCGNLKDPEKIKAKIAQVEADHKREFIDKAALSPVSGQVVAVGYRQAETTAIDTRLKLDEPVILEGFWKTFSSAKAHNHHMIGHNICGFDLPFLVRRSWLHDVAIPESILERGRYWNPVFIDTMGVWGCGSRGGNGYVTLDSLAKFFGVGGKPDDCTGADFAKMLAGKKEDQAKALAYLKNDLDMTWQVAERMGLV